MIAPSGLRLTPLNVMEFRTQLLTLHRHTFPRQHQNVTAAQLDAMYVPFEQAEIVIWDMDIWNMATAGHEIFKGTSGDMGDAPSQLWFSAIGPWNAGEDIFAPCFLMHNNRGRAEVLFLIWKAGLPYFGPYEDGELARSDDLAALAFLSSTIVEYQTHPIRPSVAKHWRKRNIYLPEIKTVILRRKIVEYGDSLSAAPISWSHRWHVRPHWALRACGKQHEERKQVFINGYIKGPDDKPLIWKETIFKASR